MRLTLQEAFGRFQAQANLSRSTLTVYAQAVERFYEFLRSQSAGQLSLAGDEPAQAPLEPLGANPEDQNLLLWFVTYLGREAVNLRPGRGKAAGRPGLEPATVRLYAQAAISWFRWMDDELLLPARFPATAAINKALRRLRTYVPASEARDGAPEPPEGIESLVHAYDHLEIPRDLPAKQRKRREREALRNRALLYALADSGARVSEVLQLTADHVRGARVNRQGVWSVQVRGKGRGERLVTLRFTHPTLQALRAYLKARDDPGATALFVSHARTRPQYRGRPMSSNAVWRMIERTARRLGLPHIHPHDFRHWRATRMLQAGVPIDQVQRYLNHRSIRTTQLYAQTAERQVDEAGARTSPLQDETPPEQEGHAAPIEKRAN